MSQEAAARNATQRGAPHPSSPLAQAGYAEHHRPFTDAQHELAREQTRRLSEPGRGAPQFDREANEEAEGRDELPDGIDLGGHAPLRDRQGLEAGPSAVAAGRGATAAVHPEFNKQQEPKEWDGWSPIEKARDLERRWARVKPKPWSPVLNEVGQQVGVW